ncbi:MAG: PCMD domain-containing protein [Segatella oulorum]
MNSKVKLACMAVACTLLSSCFKDEAPNAEADIEKVSIVVDYPMQVFYNVLDGLVEVPSAQSDIVVETRRQNTVTHYKPTFVLTPGATITPADGSEHDFSQGPVTYTVTSEDGQHHRTYTLRIQNVARMVGDTVRFDFEHVKKETLGSGFPDYDTWQEEQNGSLNTLWASGNGGFALTTYGQPSSVYPTQSVEGYEGKGVQLTTRSTGPLGAMFGSPIAAGNLFYGHFDTSNAAMEPLKATQFGHPFDRKPLRFTGYYQYTPAKKVTDKQNHELTDVKDSAAVYAIFYRNHDAAGHEVVIDGTNVKTSPAIIARADMGYVAPQTAWTAFDVAFAYTSEIDLDVLENNGYSLALVFSSSKRGDVFIGAVGSTLKVDRVRVVCEKEQQ